MVEKDEFTQHIYGQIVLKAWKDPDFKKRLIEKPRETLKEMGLNIPEKVQLDVHLQSAEHLHLIIPEKPQKLGELSYDEMRKTVGGQMQETWEGYRS